MPNVLWRLAAVAALVLANGFFVAAEFALVTVRKTRVEQLVAEGHSAAKALRTALTQLDRYIAGTQVGITLASLALGWLGEPAFAALLAPLFAAINPAWTAATDTVAIVLAFTFITFLHVIVGELVPKSLALQRPEAVALAVARPLALATQVFRPLIWSLNGLGHLVLRALGLATDASHDVVHSATELELLVRDSHKAGALDDLEKLMLQRTFRFSETTVAEVMVPRAEMVALDLGRPVADLLALAASAHRSRLPVFRTSIDQIDGVVYLHELLALVLSTPHPTSIEPLVREPLYVPESLHLDAIIERMRQKKSQMAIVVDEYGVTAGLLTLDDVVEAIFGALRDRFDDEAPQVRKGRNGALVVRGDIRLVELEETLGWRPDDADSETLGGYVMERLGTVPKAQDAFTEHGWQFRVTTMARNRVAEVTIAPLRKARLALPPKRDETSV